MASSKKVRKVDVSAVETLAKAVGMATKSSLYCVSGALPAVDPEIKVEGLGVVKLPLKGKRLKELIDRCKVAPFGKGEQTLVDTEVRKTFELDSSDFQLGDAWNAAVAEATRQAAEDLGLPADRLEPRLYKLLVYEKGGFFLPHRDSEKHDRMVASLIAVLPNPFEGGALVVRHGAVDQTLRFEEAAKGKTPCYAAFYADCEHEVKRVSYGLRLCLAYNLVLKEEPKNSRGKPAPTPDDNPLVDALNDWIAKQTATPLVFALEHHYTERGLSLDLLKGADRQLADLVAEAAASADCLVHMAQVTRHVSQFADDGSYGYGYSSRYDRQPRRRSLEIGEIYEDELNASEWTDLEGEKQPFGAISLDLSAIVSSVSIDKWKPTTEEYEGYTGNAGNTLDRWYHRSALVVWPRAEHFAIVALGGTIESIPLFHTMTSKLAKTPKKDREAARLDLIRFARAIIVHWPRRTGRSQDSTSREDTVYKQFSTALLKLHDRDAITLFLAKMAEQDQTSSLSSFIIAACREFGWKTFAGELKSLITTRPETYGPQDVPYRDVEWLAAVCLDKTDDPEKSALVKELSRAVVERFCEPRPPRPSYRYYGEKTVSTSEKSLPTLVQALATIGLQDELARVLTFVEQSPQSFSLDDCQVPALKTLIPWSREELAAVPPSLAAWLVAVRHRLESSTASKPTPPADGARTAEVACRCGVCVQLNAFLADPSTTLGRIPAREDLRRHLTGKIDEHRCDVTHTLERKGSPFSLVLKKTTGSFDRALKRYEKDCELLKSLPPAGKSIR